MRSARPGKLFIVGDPKQSIYRFRGTDVETYWQVNRQIERQGGRRLQLSTSFRSVPGIQRFVNAAFQPDMVLDATALQPDYVPLSEWRRPFGDQPAVVALPVPKPYSDRAIVRKPSAWAIERSLPDAVGAFVAWMVDPAHGWQVTERDADDVERPVQLQPRHIAILFRRFSSFGEDVTSPTWTRSRPAASRTCSSAEVRFTVAKRWRRCARRSRPIEWPDDELSRVRDVARRALRPRR